MWLGHLLKIPKSEGEVCETHIIHPVCSQCFKGAAAVISQGEVRGYDVNKQLSNKVATDKRNVTCITTEKPIWQLICRGKKLYSCRVLFNFVLVLGIKETHVTAVFLCWLQAAV